MSLNRGDRVTFNIGKEDGELMTGTVTRTGPNDSVLISPDKRIMPGLGFFNIKKLERKS